MVSRAGIAVGVSLVLVGCGEVVTDDGGADADDQTDTDTDTDGADTDTDADGSDTDNPGCVPTDEIVFDPGFEAVAAQDGDEPWASTSTNFGSSLCNEAQCEGGGSPHTGAYWMYFGGTEPLEEGTATQVVTIADAGDGGVATLQFFLSMPSCAEVMGGDTDRIELSIDGSVQFTAISGDPRCGINSYAPVTLDVTAYADGGSHELRFYGITQNGPESSFFVDDVTISVACP